MSVPLFTYFVYSQAGVDQVLVDLAARLIAKTPLKFEVFHYDQGTLHEPPSLAKNATLADLDRLPRVLNERMDEEGIEVVRPRISQILSECKQPASSRRLKFVGAEWLKLDAALKLMPLVAPPSLPEVPPVVVRPVSTYTGSFTIGDPHKPLLELPIRCLPYTREASASKLSHTSDSKVDSRVAKVTTQRTSKGPLTGSEKVVKGFRYLREIVPVTNETLDIMQGEFEGARITENAFELLATAPKLPPWILMEKTDLVVPTDDAGASFLATFACALSDRGMYALARRSKRGVGGKRKGLVEILALIPYKSSFLATRLPFAHEYMSHYRFARLDETPESLDQDLDEMMDALVAGATTSEPIEPIRNERIVRVSDQLLRNVVNKYRSEYFSEDADTIRPLQGDKETTYDDTDALHPTLVPLSLFETGSKNWKLTQEIAASFQLTRRERVTRQQAAQEQYYTAPNPDIEDLL